jgi:hypothetical protein
LKGEKALFVAEKKVERGMSENGRHIPNRIFRGRIVEFVRKNNGCETTIEELGRVVKKDYVESEGEWLIVLLEKLVRDGLIHFEKNGNKLALLLGK